MSHPFDEFWIAPDGTGHPEAPAGAIEAGWVHAVPGTPIRLEMREGAIAANAAIELRKALSHVAQDHPTESNRANGPLIDVLRRIQRGSWHASASPDPAVALAAALADLHGAEVEAALSRHLRAGLESGNGPDETRFRAALLSVSSTSAEASREIVSPSDPVARRSEEQDAAAAATFKADALARIARFEAYQARNGAAWIEMASACAGAAGLPGEPKAFESCGDVLIDLRRARERRTDISAEGLSAAWKAFPDPELARALYEAQARIGLGARYLGVARKRIEAGDHPRGILSFYVDHECARHFSLSRWMVDGLAERFQAALDARSSAPPGP